MASRKRGAVEPEVLLSASGLSRLGECEARWLWHPDEDAPELAQGRALWLGSAVHALVEARLRGTDWRDMLVQLAEETTGWEPGYQLPDPLPTAEWLMHRHEQRYPTLPAAVTTENQFELWLPDAPVPTKVRGRMDGVVMLTAADLAAMDAPESCVPGLYVWETKTMGKWDRLDWLDIDPQLGTYIWAAREMGFVGVKGVVYDAILTYQWVKDRPVEESFRRLVIPVNERLVDSTLNAYRRASRRAADIKANADLAVKSIGRNCVRCPAYGDCHGAVVA